MGDFGGGNGNGGNKGGDLFNRDFGQGVVGGSAVFQRDGSVHHTVFGNGPHFSWDVRPDGSVTGVHGTDHSAPKGDPGRHF